MRLIHLAAAIALVTATAGAAQAQETPPADPNATPPSTTPAGNTGGGSTGSGMGQQGQMVITGDLQFELSHSSTNMGGGSSNTIAIQPSLDYFVAPQISVGGTLAIAHSSLGGGSTGSLTLIGIGARGGYLLNINEMLSLWPQLQLSYAHLSFSPGSATGSSVSLAIFAPLLYHITQHLFFGIGPSFSTDLMSKVMSMDAPKTTDFGLTSVVGGYFP